MSITNRERTIALASLLVALVWAGSAQAQLGLSPYYSGGELQIGTGLPLPVADQGIFLGGMTMGDAGNFPPLLVVPDPAATVMQTAGGALTIPAGALKNTATVRRPPIAVFNTNPAVYQVRTTLNYAWPNSEITFAPGGAPGPAVTGTPGGGVIAYSGGAAAFGGAAQFALAPGPAAGVAPALLGVRAGTMTMTLSPGGMTGTQTVMAGRVPIATVWINAFKKLPQTATKALIAGASNPLGVAAPGASLAKAPATTFYGPGGVAVGLMAGSNGTVNASVFVKALVPDNHVTATKGFPWTTGLITVSQPGAVPPEVFFLSGTDMRLNGVGNVSLVSGALSLRNLSGPNANRGWLSLSVPEPTAALGAASALAMLALCHGLLRRRSR